MNKYKVVTHNVMSPVTVEAERIDESDGTLFFYDEHGSYCAIFARNEWCYVQQTKEEKP